MVESTNEKERLKFCDKKEFYPEIGFNFLKNYEKIMEKRDLNSSKKVSLKISLIFLKPLKLSNIILLINLKRGSYFLPKF